MRGEHGRHGPADVRDPERHEKTCQRRGLAPFQAIQEVLRGLVRKAVQAQELVLRQLIQVRRIVNDFPVRQLGEGCVAESLDVHGRDEMPQVLEDLGGTARIDAPGDGRTRFPDEVGPAFRARPGHVPRLAGCRAFFSDDTNDFRDHIAGSLDDDVVPCPHVFARDLVLVVQRRPADGRPADLDRR